MRRNLGTAVAAAFMGTAFLLPLPTGALQAPADATDRPAAAEPSASHDLAVDLPVASAEAHRATVDGRQTPDFLFSRPAVSITLRVGGLFPRAEGQFFDFLFDTFILERDHFRSFNGGVDVGVWVTERVEVFGSLDVASATRRSEYRDWEEEREQGFVPIEQTTRLRQGPAITAGVKFYPAARGESLSRFIWVPDRVSPYLSAGLGGTGWKLEQWGDFVDEAQARIFEDHLQSDGFSFLSFLGAGLDVTLRPRVALNLDTRYLIANGRMDQNFIDFHRPFDLSGLRLSAGLSFRF